MESFGTSMKNEAYADVATEPFRENRTQKNGVKSVFLLGEYQVVALKDLRGKALSQ
jgi:hypothetical protein